MLPADLVKHIPSEADPTVRCIVQALPDGFEDVCTRCHVEQVLVGLCILHDGLRFAVDRENDGPLALLELFEKLARLAPKCG
jgi:hypothetical protein